MFSVDGRWWGGRRLLLAFAPDDEHPDFQAQRQLVAGLEDRMREHGLVFGQVLERGESRLGREGLDPSRAGALRRQFRAAAGCFTLVLVGPDGRELARSTEATPVPDVLAKVDEVPMHRRDLEAARRRPGRA